MPALDVHAHMAASDTLAEMREVHSDGVPELDRDGQAVFFRYPSGVVNGPAPRGIVDIERRLEDMDEARVDHQVVSARPQLFTYDLPADIAERLAGLSNAGLVAGALAQPDRISAMVSLPLQSAEASLREVERWAGEPAVRGVLIDSNVAGRDLSDAHFDPVWAALEAADLPVLVHPYQADVVGKERLSKHYLFNLIGNPADTTIAIANVVFGGVLDRYPLLRWGFVHGGGVAPYLAGRWDHGWRRREVTRERIPESLPSELLKRCWFDCLVHEPATLRYLGDLVGWDRIMLGSDYPFDMGLTDPVGFVERVGLPSEEREAVLSGNSETFLRSR
jgi:aminocarboxymuconate-semialdehyde decarboxylase